MREWKTDLMLLVALLSLPAIRPVRAAAQGSVASAESGGTILSLAGPWRWAFAWRTPVFTADNPKFDAMPVDQRSFTHRPKIQYLQTPPPPADWMKPSFTPTDWPRDMDVLAEGDDTFQLGLLAARALFRVADPADAKGLRLELAFRGGAVVYVNGTELGRAGMPEGAVAPMSPATPYGDDVWVDAMGEFLKEKDAGELAAKRTRKLTAEIPARLLTKGVNVLAIELHRGDYHPTAANWFRPNRNMTFAWVPIGLLDARLTADAAVEANTGVPGPLRVYNMNVHDRLDAASRLDGLEGLDPVRIVAPRNGIGAGAVVLAAGQDISGVKVSTAELKGANGSIAAANVHIRFAVPGVIDTLRRKPALDGLLDAPLETVKAAPAALVPVWMTVDVPAGAEAGQYRGELTVSANGLPAVKVPVELTVPNWKAPSPRDFRTVVNLYQSPTTLAMKYEVPMWSETHWKLMDRAFALLGQVGCDMVNIPVVEQTQFGNDEGFVRWIRAEGGGFRHDYSILDRYLELVARHLGTPRFVALQVWHAGGWGARKPDHQNTVTVIDPATGKRVESLQVPPFGTGESKAFWTPVLHTLRDKLAARGMGKGLCIGILGDGVPDDGSCAMFNEILPNVGWTMGCHKNTFVREPIPMRGGGAIVCQEFCYGLEVKPFEDRFPTIWDMPGPGIAYIRKDFDHIPPVRMRLTAERGLYCNTPGIARFCLDFWRLPNGRARPSNIFNRYPHSSCAQREPTTCMMAHPGPDGPVSTVRLELFREGLQEAEAAIVIAEAARIKADAIGEDLTRRCDEVLRERVKLARLTHESYDVEAWDASAIHDASLRLFQAAGEVSDILGKGR